jgi:hypothetical protein
MIRASCVLYIRNSQRDVVKSRRESVSFLENEETQPTVSLQCTMQG